MMHMAQHVDGFERCTAYLNGEKLPLCLEADDSAGWALCAVTGDDGRPLPDPAHEDGIRTEIRRGAVTFAFDPPRWRAMAEAHLAESARAMASTAKLQERI